MSQCPIPTWGSLLDLLCLHCAVFQAGALSLKTRVFSFMSVFTHAFRILFLTV